MQIFEELDCGIGYYYAAHFCLSKYQENMKRSAEMGCALASLTFCEHGPLLVGLQFKEEYLTCAELHYSLYQFAYSGPDVYLKRAAELEHPYSVFTVACQNNSDPFDMALFLRESRLVWKLSPTLFASFLDTFVFTRKCLKNIESCRPLGSIICSVDSIKLSPELRECVKNYKAYRDQVNTFSLCAKKMGICRDVRIYIAKWV